MIFRYFFQQLFNKEGNAFLLLENAVTEGFKTYKNQML
jgi:hypothetical protein